MRDLEGRDVILCVAATAAAITAIEWLTRLATEALALKGGEGQVLPILLEWVLMFGAAAHVPNRLLQGIRQGGYLIWRVFIPAAMVASITGTIAADPGIMETAAGQSDLAAQATRMLLAQTGARFLVLMLGMMLGNVSVRRLGPEDQGLVPTHCLALIGDLVEEEAAAAVEEMCRLARSAYEKGNLARAETLYQQVLALAPNLVEARLGLGYVSIYTHKHGVAEEQFDRVLAMGTHDAEAHAGLGYMHLLRTEIVPAEQRFRASLRADRDCVQGLVGLGHVLLMRAEYAKALPLLERAANLKPHSANAHEGLGGAYLGLERYQDAVAEFDRALELRPEYADVHYRRGLAYLAMGAVEQGVADWRKALALSPTAWFAAEVRERLQRRDQASKSEQT